MTNATKEQERQALAEIKKMVEALGKGSYIAAAFTGVFELAEQNIDGDLFLSYPDELEHTAHGREEIRKSAEKYAQDAVDATQRADHLQKTLTEAETARDEAQKELADTQAELEDLQKTNATLTETICKQATQIVSLKARLFDALQM